MISEGLNNLWSTPVYLTKAEIPDLIVEHILTNYGDSKKVSANVSGDNINLLDYRYHRCCSTL